MRRSLFLLATGALLLGGCDTRINPLITSLDQSPGGNAAFNLSPTTVRLNTGQSAQLTLNSSRPIGPYNWSSNQTGIATVTSDGLVTGIGPGVAIITVTSSVDRTVSASATVSVQSATESP